MAVRRVLLAAALAAAVPGAARAIDRFEIQVYEDDINDPGQAPATPGSPAHESPWELNLGFGGALTSAPGPHVLVKAIVGRAF